MLGVALRACHHPDLPAAPGRCVKPVLNVTLRVLPRESVVSVVAVWTHVHDRRARRIARSVGLVGPDVEMAPLDARLTVDVPRACGVAVIPFCIHAVGVRGYVHVPVVESARPGSTALSVEPGEIPA